MNCPSCGGPMRLEVNHLHLVCEFCRRIHFPEPDETGMRVLDVDSASPCPVCRKPLVHANLAQAPILACRICRGLLIDMDTFLVLIERLRADQTAPAPPPRPSSGELERRIECPSCRKLMDTHPYGGPGNIIIDNCPRCRLNWLDYPELLRVARAPEGWRPPDTML